MHQEELSVILVGPVSAGKSTLLNAIFSDTYSEMKRKKTTMLPQVYNVRKADLYNSKDDILFTNSSYNEEILKLRDEKKYDKVDKVIEFTVPPIFDFIHIPDKDAIYKIIDMPGLNCGNDSIYYDYVARIAHTIDLYILVFDINSGLNTSDEVTILQFINNLIKTHGHGYVHVIINKADNVEFNTHTSFKFNDDELEELYGRSIDTVYKHLSDVDEKHITIGPLCSNQLYVYRCIKNNINSIDETQLNTIIKEEVGKTELSKLRTLQNKQKYIQGMIIDKEEKYYDNWMKDTGYGLFKLLINSTINTNYCQMIENHIIKELQSIKVVSTTEEYSMITELIQQCIDRLNKLKTIYPNYKNNSNINENIDRITSLLNDDTASKIVSCTLNDTDSFISKIKKFINTITFFNNNPSVTSLAQLEDKRIFLLNNELSLNYNRHIFSELCSKGKLDMGMFQTCIKNSLHNNNYNFESLMMQIYPIGTYCIYKVVTTIYTRFMIDGNIDILITNILTLSKVNYRDGIMILIYKWIALHTNGENDSFKQSISTTYSSWILLHNSDIVKCVPEIQFIFMQIYAHMHGKMNNNPQVITFEQFNECSLKMDKLFNVLKNVYNPTTTLNKSNTITKSSTKLIEVSSNDDQSEDTYEDALDVISDSETYIDSDTPNKVFQKAKTNVSKRTIKTINKSKK